MHLLHNPLLLPRLRTRALEDLIVDIDSILLVQIAQDEPGQRTHVAQLRPRPQRG